MSLTASLGSSRSRTNVRTQEQRNTERDTRAQESSTSQQNQNEREAGTASARSRASSQVNLLDDDMRVALGSYLTNVMARGEDRVANTLDVNAIMDESRRQAEVSLGQEFQQQAGAAGSSYNTAVQQAQSSSRLAGQTALNAQETQLTQASQAAGSSAEVQQAQAIASLGEILRGAQQTTVQESSSEEENLRNLIAELTNTLSSTRTEQVSEQTDTDRRVRGRSSTIGASLGFGG